MNDVNELKIIIKGMESRDNERYEQQLKFNGQVTSTLESINTAINKIEVFQSEMNNTNLAVDRIRVTQEYHSTQINMIKEGRAGDKTLLDELKQWRVLIFGSFAAAIVTAVISTIFLPSNSNDEITKVLIELTKIMQENK